MTKITTDLSKLSNIPEDILDKLMNLIMKLIGEYVYQNYLVGKDITEIDLGFGQLLLNYTATGLKIKFIPCKELEHDIQGIINGKKSNLNYRLEKSLAAKLNDLYKDFL